MGTSNSKLKSLQRDIRNSPGYAAGSTPGNTTDLHAQFPQLTNPIVSLNSSIQKPTVIPPYKVIDGRQFKAVGNPKYMLPGDDEELDRLLIAHYAVRFLFQGNFRVPIKKGLENGINVLDVGCGPGSWTLEMATDFPNSDFCGIDIAEVFPAAIVPRNVKFQKVDVLKGLPFGDNTFDYVYQRSMNMSYSEKEWPNMIKELLRVTKPGGWIELVETDLLIHDAGPITESWFSYFAEGLKARGIDFKIPRRLDKLLRAETAISPIKKIYYSSPVGWGEEKFGGLGELLRQNVEMSFKSLKPVLATALGISSEDYDEMTSLAVKELVENKSWTNYYAAWGQKVRE